MGSCISNTHKCIPTKEDYIYKNSIAVKKYKILFCKQDEKERKEILRLRDLKDKEKSKTAPILNIASSVLFQKRQNIQ